MSFYRSLSPLEASYVATEEAEHAPFINQFLMKGEGTLDLDDWKAASDKVAEANPGIRLNVKGFWGWRYWDDKGLFPSVRKITTDWDGNSPENAPTLFEAINSRKGPNAEIILIESSNAPPSILFRTHHALTDGMGMLHWIEECFRALRGEPLEGSKGTANEWDIIKLHEKPEKTLFDGNCASLMPISSNPEQRYCRWIHCKWPLETTKNVLPRLLLASTKVAREKHTEGRTLFRVPSDLRWYQGKGADFSMANASGAFDIETNEDSTIDSLRREIRKGMKSKADLSVFPSNLYLANWLPKSILQPKAEVLKNIHSTGKYRMTGTISYVGERNFETMAYDKFAIKALCGIPISLENRGFFIGATNTSDTLSLTIGVPRATATHDELLKLGEELHQAFDSVS